MALNVDLAVYIRNTNISTTTSRAAFIPADRFPQDETMIASVIATLADVGHFEEFVDEVSQMPGVEMGDVGKDARRIPITIESLAPNALEDITTRLQECRGVAFVDVVFVHFEDDPETEAPTYPGEMDHS